MTFTYQGPKNDAGEFFSFESTVEVVDSDDAHLKGREFAILSAAANKGMVEGQTVAYQLGD